MRVNIRPVKTEDQVVFALRPLSAAELAAARVPTQLQALQRAPVAAMPELCFPHGQPGTWSRTVRCWSMTAFYRKPQWLRIFLIFLTPRLPAYWWAGRHRGERRRTQPSVQFQAFGCPSCRRRRQWHLARAVALGLASPAMFFVVPRLVLPYSELLGSILVLYGWLIPILLGAFVFRSFRDWFSHVAMSDRGDELWVGDPHPRYREAAVRAGAEYRTDQPKIRPDGIYTI